MAAPIAISETIFYVDKENTGLVEVETAGVLDKNTGVAMSDDRENTGVPITEDDYMASIDAEIMEVVATLYQELREVNAEPEETKDVEVSHPNTTTKTTRRVYNLCKGKNGNRGCDYSHRFGDHLMALLHIALTQLSTKSVMRKYKREGRAAVKKDFLQLHT